MDTEPSHRVERSGARPREGQQEGKAWTQSPATELTEDKAWTQSPATEPSHRVDRLQGRGQEEEVGGAGKRTKKERAWTQSPATQPNHRVES